MSIEIVKADYQNPKHAEDIVTLLDIYARDPMGGGEPLSDFVKANLAQELAKRPHAFTVLSYVDGQAAGLINCFELFSTFACRPLVNIHDIIVLSDFRRMHLSHKMLDKVEEISRENGCCKLTLEVLEGNLPAKNSYTKFGFAPYQLNPEMGNAVFMQKSLK